MNSRAPWMIGLGVAAAVALAGCSTMPGPTTAPASSMVPPGYGTLGSGFFPNGEPAAEGTATPAPGSWDDAHPPAGYTVVLLTYGDDAPTRTLVRAVKSWAAAEKVALTTIAAKSVGSLIDTVYRAVREKPALIISAGEALVDPLAAVTAGVLDQQFLVVGAELAEPTANVTAADWTGAGFRGEGLGTPAAYDPKSFTDERAGRAVRAGIGAVVNHYTGIVIWVG